MSSLSPACTELKRKYDECFNKWYSEQFLKGNVTPACEELFKDYRACVWAAIKEKKIDGLIDEARKEHPFGKVNDTGVDSKQDKESGKR